jgi:hypothetical protein
MAKWFGKVPVLVLERAYLPDGSATLGKLSLPDGWSCYTLENPWKDNQARVSCIPEGGYALGLRESPVVQRTTSGRYREGWEVQDVPDRTFVMVHPGNWEHNTEGCILPGRAFSWDGRHGPMVTHSQDTFDALMARLDAGTWRLRIVRHGP